MSEAYSNIFQVFEAEKPNKRDQLRNELNGIWCSLLQNVSIQSVIRWRVFPSWACYDCPCVLNNAIAWSFVSKGFQTCVCDLRDTKQIVS